MLTKLQFEVFLKGEYIVHAGAKGDKMYFIRTGVVEVLSDQGVVATTLSDGSHFGEICLLTDDRRVASIRALTICDLFSLSKKNFQKLLDEFPEMRCTLETVALHRLNLLGKEPKPDEIKKRGGRISTTIPPPHIGKDASRSQDDTLMQCNHVAECACYNSTLEEQEDTTDIIFASSNKLPEHYSSKADQLSFADFHAPSEHSVSATDGQRTEDRTYSTS